MGFIKYFTLIITFLFSLNSFATDWYSKNNAVNSGYDVVAYFTESQPVKGEKQYSYEWNDGTWYFSSRQNKELFVASPEKYAPQYGGYCAYAVAKGSKAKVDPDAWTIIDGKLYLNYSKSVRKQWLQNTDENIKKANANWPKLNK